MKVIMLKDVGGVGRRGEVKEVSDGFALNSLIPSGSAQQATPGALAAAEARQKSAAAARAAEESALKSRIQSLENAALTMRVRATDKGGLFKSVTESDVVKLVADQRGVVIDAGMVTLPAHIKAVGEYPLMIRAAGAAARVVLRIEAL